MQLFGGKDCFTAELDNLFVVKSDIEGDMVDITGLIGQYAQGNEPSHHMAYLYNYVGQPWKTQEMTRRILAEMYQPTPEGISGNEDCGQMSAWYILSSLGIYSVCPGIKQDFKITPDQLEKAITPKTRAIILCSPSNPTGSVYSKAELKGLADVLAKYPDIMIIADEIYEHINYVGRHESIAQFEDIKDRVIIINGVSKAYAMTRMG